MANIVYKTIRKKMSIAVIGNALAHWLICLSARASGIVEEELELA